MRSWVIALSVTVVAGCHLETSGFGLPEDDASTLDAGRGADAEPFDARTSFDATATDATVADAFVPPDAPPDAGCPAGTYDLDGDPDNGCEYVCIVTGVEACNDRDDDCDGTVDGPAATGYRAFYRDADSDGHGDATMSMSGCTAPSGFVASSDDCADGDPARHPGAPELCNARDENCDGVADDSAPCPSCAVLHYGGRPHLFCDAARSFSAAETFCVGVGYHLATIDDAAEDVWVATAARTARATGWWIGFHDRDRDGTYAWMGAASTYTGWLVGEPSRGTEYCALIAWGGPIVRSWNDGDCGVSFPFVCEP